MAPNKENMLDDSSLIAF